MPLFDYTCEKCNIEKKDVLVRFAEELVFCTECGEPMRRHFPSDMSFLLKGGGWATDNYTKPKPIPPAPESND